MVGERLQKRKSGGVGVAEAFWINVGVHQRLTGVTCRMKAARDMSLSVIQPRCMQCPTLLKMV